MAANASNIKASEAYVTIRADEGNLPKVIDAARKRAQDFAGSVSMLGEKVGGKFGASVIGGLVGFAAVGGVDRALKSLMDPLERWVDGGDSNGWEIGATVGQSILDGLKSVPLAGTLGEILALTAGDWLWGNPMQIERMLDSVAKQREAIQAILSKINAATTELDNQIINFGNAPGLERSGMEDSVSSFVNQLVQQGYSLRFARESAEGIVKSFERLMTLKADASFMSINDQLQEMAGRVPQDTKELQRFEAQLESLANTLRAAGRVNEIDELTGALRQEFEWIRIVRAAEKESAEVEALVKKRQDSIGKMIENLRQSFLSAGLDDNTKLRFELFNLGANRAQVAEFERLMKMLDEFRKFEKDSAEVTGIINDLQSNAARASLGERGFLEKRLRDLQATQDQINTALSLFDQTAIASVESSFIGSFSPAALEGGFPLGGLEDSSRETARNTRRMAQALERNQLTYGN